MKLSLEFWPGVEVVVTGGPYGVFADASAGTSWSVSVMLPVAAACRPIRIVMPVCVSVRVSIKPAPRPKVAGAEA